MAERKAGSTKKLYHLHYRPLISDTVKTWFDWDTAQTLLAYRAGENKAPALHIDLLANMFDKNFNEITMKTGVERDGRFTFPELPAVLSWIVAVIIII